MHTRHRLNVQFDVSDTNLNFVFRFPLFNCPILQTIAEVVLEVGRCFQVFIFHCGSFLSSSAVGSDEYQDRENEADAMFVACGGDLSVCHSGAPKQISFPPRVAMKSLSLAMDMPL